MLQGLGTMVRSKSASYVLLLAFGFRLCVPVFHCHRTVTLPCANRMHGVDDHRTLSPSCPQDCPDPYHHHHAPHDPNTCVICKLTECSSHYVACAATSIPRVEMCGFGVIATVASRHDVSPPTATIRGPPLPPTATA